MASDKVGYEILYTNDQRFSACLMYYAEHLAKLNKTIVYYRVMCGYRSGKITLPEDSLCKVTIYKDDALLLNGFYNYKAIAQGWIYEEIVEEIVPEEEIQEEIEEIPEEVEEIPEEVEELVEDVTSKNSARVIEELPPEEEYVEVHEEMPEIYVEEIIKEMERDDVYIDGCSSILDDYIVVENGIFDGSSVNIRISVDVDTYKTSEYWGNGEISFYTNSMSWTKDPSSIYPSAYSAQMGETLNLTISSSNINYKHEVKIMFGDDETLIFVSASIPGGTYRWTIPDVANLCNNATSGTLKILCQTFVSREYKGASEINITLTVPDPSTPEIAESIVLGRAYSISFYRNSTNFTNRLEFVFENQTIKIYEGESGRESWTPPYDMAKKIPSLISKAGTLKCTTLNGTAVVGIKTVNVTVYVPENDTTKPTFPSSGLTLAPISSLGSAFSGLYIRSKTGLKATMSASSVYSTIKGYSLTVGSISVEGNPGIVDLLVDEGNVTVTAKVTDARGFSRTVTKTIYIYPYRRPKVVPYSGYSEVICERAKSSGELSPKGTYLAIKAGKSYSVISPSGTNLNPCILRYRWKKSSSSQYGTWNTILANGSAALEKTLLVGNIVSSLSTSYDVEIQVSDALGGEHTLTFAIMTEAISFVLYDGVDGAGFGKYPEEPHVVDIAAHMTLRVRGKFVVDGNGWVTLGLASGISESVYNYGRNDLAACSYQVSNGNHVHVAFNCAFYYGGSAKVINSNAIPVEYRPVGTVYALCPMNDRYIALVSVASDGYIRVEWVQNLKDTVQTGSASVTWMDGYLDYWT